MSIEGFAFTGAVLGVSSFGFLAAMPGIEEWQKWPLATAVVVICAMAVYVERERRKTLARLDDVLSGSASRRESDFIEMKALLRLTVEQIAKNNEALKHCPGHQIAEG